MSAPAGGTAPFRRVLLIVVALILYGSLYPWQFHARLLPASPPWVLLHSWPAAIDRYILWDVIVNIVLYAPLGVFAFLAVDAAAPRWRRLALPLALAASLSAAVEMLQLFDDGRMCSGADLVSNVAGAGLGIAAGALYRGALQRFLARGDTAALLRPSGALLLLACWLGYQLFPLFPAWGRTGLLRRIAALGAGSAISLADTFIIFAEWLALLCLLDGILKARTAAVLSLVWLVLPVRLIVTNRTLDWPDILGAAAAYAAWLCVPRNPVRRAAPALLAAAVIVGELAPFHFAGAQAFNWVPFRGIVRASWQNGFMVLFRKSYTYGAIAWLWRRSGLWLAAGVTAAALFLLERAQIHLPGRTPDITDPILALLMSAFLWLLRDA